MIEAYSIAYGLNIQISTHMLNCGLSDMRFKGFALSKYERRSDARHDAPYPAAHAVNAIKSRRKAVLPVMHCRMPFGLREYILMR